MDGNGRRSSNNHVLNITRPATYTALWDSRGIGDQIEINFTDDCKVDVHLEETTLRLLQRFSEQKPDSKYLCSLVGSISVQSDDGRLVLHVERLAERADDKTPGEIIIPCTVNVNSARPLTCEADLSAAIQKLDVQSSDMVKLDLAQLLSPQVLCSYHSNRTSSTFHVDVNMVTFSARMSITPIATVPIVPTALSKNLTGPIGLINPHSEPKSGFLAMDQTRRVLLILESDPKCSSLPLVGVWVGTVASLTDPRVWASCVRYATSKRLNDSLRSPPEPFLILVYSAGRQRPQFYECRVPTLSPSLLNGHEVIQLHKGGIGELPEGIDVEMLHVQSGPKSDTFHTAVQSTTSSVREEHAKGRQLVEDVGQADDTLPRSQLRPHQFNGPSLFQSSVPDVSLLFEESHHNTVSRTNAGEVASSHNPAFSSHPPSHTHSPVTMVSRAPPETRPGFVASHQSQRQPLQNQLVGYPPVRPVVGEQGAGYQVGRMANQMRPTMPHPHFQRHRHPLPPQHPLPHAEMVVQGMHQRPPTQTYPHGPGSPAPHCSPVYHPQQYTSHSVRPNMPPCDPVNYTTPPAHHTAISMATGHPYQHHPGDTGHYPRQYNTHPAAQPVLRTSHSDSRRSEGQAVSHKPVGSVQSLPHYTVAKPLQSKGSPTASGSSSLETSPVRNSVSTDSGLQVETLNDSMDSLPSTYHTGDASHRLSDVSQVPTDVLERLKTQDQQLQELRQQLAQLMAKQSGTDQGPTSKAVCDTATQSSGTLTPGDEKQPASANKSDKCSIAINTSLWLSEPPPSDHDTSSQTANLSGTPHNAPQTPHQPAVCPRPLVQQPQPVYHSSPVRPDQYVGISHLENESLSLGEFHLTAVPEPSDESYVSEMIVDMPAYTSMSPDKLDRRSWGSTHCSSNSSHSYSTSQSKQPSEEELLESTLDPQCNADIQDQKKFYENLIGNVRRFLGQLDDSHQSTETEVADHQPDVIEQMSESPPPTPPDVHHKMTSSVSLDVGQMTRQQLSELGVDLNQILNNSAASTRCDQSTMLLDAALLPKVNYQSLWLDGTESEGSSDFDALAMKYLSDEQLSELARLQSSSKKSHTRSGRGLDGLLEDKSKSRGSDVSAWGLPLNHMSFASKKYLERYGLLNETGEGARCESVPSSPQVPANQHIHQFLHVLAENNNMSLSESERGSTKGETARRLQSNEQQLWHGPEHGNAATAMQSALSSMGSHHSTGSSMSSHSSGHHVACAPVSPHHQRYNPQPKHRQPPRNSLPGEKPPAKEQVLDIDRLRQLPKLM